MDVTVENAGGLQRRLRVQIPESRIEGEVNDRLRSMSRTARIPGFRPGKVPIKVVAQRYGRQVRDEVVGELLRSSFYDAVVQENLRPAGSPTIDPVASGPGEGLAYTAQFEVYPEIGTPTVEGIRIARPVAEVSEADVDRMIETLRRQRRRWEPVERPAREGDRVRIDFQGRVDGEPFEGGEGEDVPVELGGGHTLADLEAGLRGARAGDAPSIEVGFPEDYRADHLAGRRAVFAVQVKAVEAPVLPELDEEFARAFGVAEGGLEGLRREVRDNLERELREAIQSRVKQRLMDALLERNPVEPPAALVQEESQRMHQIKSSELAHQGLDPAQLNLQPAMFEDQARRRIVLGLLLAEIVKSNGISADKDKVRARIEAIASTYQDPAQVVNWYYADKARMAEVESTVLEDQVVEWMLDQVQVSEERTSFDELLNPGQTTDEGGAGESAGTGT